MSDLDVKTVFVADLRPEPDIAEFALVRTLADIQEGDVRIPRGVTGTVVVAHGDGTFEIEFADPVEAVVGAHRREIEPV